MKGFFENTKGAIIITLFVVVAIGVTSFVLSILYGDRILTLYKEFVSAICYVVIPTMGAYLIGSSVKRFTGNCEQPKPPSNGMPVDREVR